MNTFLAALREFPSMTDLPVWAMLLIKLTALLSAAWLGHLMLAGANPRWRVFLWRVTAVGLIGLPVVGEVLPSLKVYVARPEPAEKPAVAGSASTNTLALHPNPLPTEERRIEGMFDAPKMDRSLVESSAQNTGSSETDQRALNLTLSRSETGPAFDLKTLAMIAWLAGIAFLCLRLLLGHARIWRTVRRAKPTPQWIHGGCERVAKAVGCRAQVELLQSADIPSPFLCGLRRPTLLLPRRMCDDSYCRDLPGILAHELTHVRSNDLRWNAALHLLSIVLWFHPLVWRMRRTHLAACELVCDAVSASFVGDVTDYCRTLARVAVDARTPLPAAGIAMARVSNISHRLSVLKRRVFDLPLRRRSVAIFAVATLLAVGMLGTLRFALAEPPDAPPSSADNAELKPVAAESKAVEPANAATGAKSSQPSSRPMQLHVFDTDQKPIGNASITVRCTTSAPFGGPVQYQTDAAGDATIDVPKEDIKDLQILVMAAGYVTAGAHWRGNGGIAGVPTEFTFTMGPGTTFGGIVCDEQRKPIAGAEVTVNGRRTSPNDPLWVSINDTTKTDTDGKWQVSRIPQDLTGFELEIRLKRPDIGGVERFDSKTLPIDKLREQTAVLVLHEGVIVEGTVTDPHQKPVAGAAVGLFPTLLRGSYPKTTTDQDGHYRFAVTEPGEYTVAAAAKDYAPDSRDIVVAEEPQKVDLQLCQGDTIRVRVVDKDGKPMPEVSVAMVFNNKFSNALMLDYESAIARDKDRHMLTDAEGRWSRRWLVGDELTLIISKPDYAEARRNLAAGGEECVITLEQGGWSIAGRVIDRETKAPVTKFRVVEGDNYSNIIWRKDSPVEHSNGEYVAKWNTSGDSRRVIRIEADGYFPSTSRQLRASERQVTFDVELSRGQNVTGVVRSPDGKTLGEAEVVLCTENRGLYLRNGRPELDQYPLLARTGADGRFSFSPQHDPYLLIAMHDQGFAEVKDKAAMADITLQPWARAQGTLRIGDKPGAKEHISLDFEDRWSHPQDPRSLDFPATRRIMNDYKTETDAEGRFVFERVRPGKAKVSRQVMLSREGAMSSWTTANSKSVELVAGQTVSVELDGADPDVVRKRELEATKRREREAAQQQKEEDPERKNRMEAAFAILQAKPPTKQDERIEAAIRILEDYRISDKEQVWATAIRELIIIGEPAVSRLIEELDRTERDETLRALGFVFRGINDPRAVPALIRAIPRVYPGGGCDFGISVKDDPELLQFMQQYDNDPKDRSQSFSFGRSIREVMPALEKLTGESLGWRELNFADSEGQGVEQQHAKRAVFLRHAERWAEWWSKNWQKHVPNEVDAQLDLTRQVLEQYAEAIAKMPRQKPLSEIPCGANVVIGSGTSNHRAKSFDESQLMGLSEGFLDLDTGRRPSPPQEMVDSSVNGEPSRALLAWAEQEGVDLITMRVKQPDSDKMIYAFKPLGMKVWRIDNDHFENLEKELRYGEKADFARLWDGLIAQIDEKTGKFDEELTVSFLFITKEGVCGAIQLQSPVSREMAPGSPVGDKGGWQYKFVFERNPDESELK